MSGNINNFIKRVGRDSERTMRGLVFGTALGIMMALLLAGTVSADTGLPNAICSRYGTTASA